MTNLLWIVWFVYMKIREWLLGVGYDVYHSVVYFLPIWIVRNNMMLLNYMIKSMLVNTHMLIDCDMVGEYIYVDCDIVGKYIYVEWLWYSWWIHICWLIVILLVNAYILSDGDVVGDCIYAKWMMMMWWWLLIELWLEVLKHVNSLRLLISSFISPKLKYINVWKTLIFYFLFFIFEGGKH